MSKQWIDWPNDECPICGDSVQIETACPQEPGQIPEINPPYCYCGDHWRCGDGHGGVTYADETTDGVMLECEGIYGD